MLFRKNNRLEKRILTNSTSTVPFWEYTTCFDGSRSYSSRKTCASGKVLSTEATVPDAKADTPRLPVVSDAPKRQIRAGLRFAPASAEGRWPAVVDTGFTGKKQILRVVGWRRAARPSSGHGICRIHEPLVPQFEHEQGKFLGGAG